MSLGRNLLAGLTSSIWSALVGFAVVPFYLRYLGIEAYGLIGFFVTTQAVLSLLDMGMAPTINREVARCSASGDMKEAGKLLHTLAVIYWCVAGVIAVLILVLAPWISEYWLQFKKLSPQTISHATMLIGLVVASRWPIGLYQGALIGAQRLTISSGINMVMATIGSLGAVAVLAFISPTIEAFFIWQACVGLVSAILMRFAAWRIIGKINPTKFDVGRLKKVWRFTAGMSGIALSATVFTQLDKIILSKTLELEDFGHYMLANVVASSLYILIMPTYTAIYPRLSALVVTAEVENLTALYRFGTRNFSNILFPVAMLIAVFAEELVHVWTGNQSIASSVAPVISILVIGSALHGIMFFPYALQLAYGMTRLPLTINTILMIISVPVTIFLSLKFGAMGGAMAWLTFHLLYTVIGTWLTHRKLLQGIARAWFFQDVFTPIGISTAIGIIGVYLVKHEAYSSVVKLLCGVLLTVIAVIFSFITTPKIFRILTMNEVDLKGKFQLVIEGFFKGDYEQRKS